eukprot:909618-Rhodomonas_salina.5
MSGSISGTCYGMPDVDTSSLPAFSRRCQALTQCMVQACATQFKFDVIPGTHLRVWSQHSLIALAAILECKVACPL